MLNITDKAKVEAIPPLFRLGFRIFFLAGSLYAALAVPIWLIILYMGQPASLQVPGLWWHAHELFFGFAMAIVAGFVLTAVQNWTGSPGTQGWPLAVLFLLWLLPRILLWLPVPLWLTSSLEALFLLGVAYAVGLRVVRSKGWRNLFFLPLFLLAILANYASYAAIKGLPPFSASAIWQAMIWWFVLLLSVMGGRVIPFFTAKRMGFTKAEPKGWLEWLANLPLFLLMLISLSPVVYWTLGPALLLWAAAAQTIRWLRWKPWTTAGEPLLWSLHLGYLFIPLGLVMLAIPALAGWHLVLLHLLTIGALGGIILAMISRVTMGHTGRNIYEGPRFGWAYALIFVSALVRTLLVLWAPEQIHMWHGISALCWSLAFLGFALLFGPMLAKPRADGHPG